MGPITKLCLIGLAMLASVCVVYTAFDVYFKTHCDGYVCVKRDCVCLTYGEGEQLLLQQDFEYDEEDIELTEEGEDLDDHI